MRVAREMSFRSLSSLSSATSRRLGSLLSCRRRSADREQLHNKPPKPQMRVRVGIARKGLNMQSRQMNVHKGLTSIRTHKSASKAGKICTICLPQQATTLVRLTQKRKSLDQADFPLGGNPPLPRYICPDRMFMTVR